MHRNLQISSIFEQQHSRQIIPAQPKIDVIKHFDERCIDDQLRRTNHLSKIDLNQKQRGTANLISAKFNVF
jgi:hypothetical protein